MRYYVGLDSREVIFKLVLVICDPDLCRHIASKMSKKKPNLLAFVSDYKCNVTDVINHNSLSRNSEFGTKMMD